MEKRMLTIAGRYCRLYGTSGASCRLIQAVDDHDLEMLDQEVEYIKEFTGTEDFCLLAFKVENWNRDLSPWEAPPVFGGKPFGDGAMETLAFVEDQILPFWETQEERISKGKKARYFLGGYSLAGLFALWSGYHSKAFAGIAAASPSVWFPGWTEFVREQACQADLVYLSLGDREEKTRNKVMAQVGGAIRQQYEILSECSSVQTTLEWNQGNHFREPDLRTTKGFAWLIKVS